MTLRRNLTKHLLAAAAVSALAALSSAPLLAGSPDTVFARLLSEGAPLPEAAAPAAPAPAAYRQEECLELASIGCFYNGAPGAGAVPLLIYYRGWVLESNYPGSGLAGGHITGAADILRSSRAALSFYKLKRLADEKRVAVLVTGSSDIAVTQADVDKLRAGLGVDFSSISAAAHSGGYVGLKRSIGTFARLERVILLDSFYDDFSAPVSDKIRQGAACTGFYTPHNAARYAKYFSGTGCRAEARTSPADHENYVPASLLKSF